MADTTVLNDPLVSVYAWLQIWVFEESYSVTVPCKSAFLLHMHPRGEWDTPRRHPVGNVARWACKSQRLQVQAGHSKRLVRFLQ